MFLQRTISSMVFAPLVGFAVYLGDGYFAALLAVISLAAAVEYRRLMSQAGVSIPAPFVVITAAVGLSGYWGGPAHLLIALIFGAMVLLVLALFSTDVPAALYGLSGELYLGGFLGALGLLRMGQDGRSWALMVLLVTWATDVGAYLGGSALGKHKMAPDISPSKSWEGAICGVLAASATGGALSGFLGFPKLFALVVGLLLGILAEAGDLMESLLKRFCKAKDSGKVIPGHGGVLDRFDSLLFTGAGGLLFRFLSGMLSSL
jgi:phosphatidate cytidylyltransferase